MIDKFEREYRYSVLKHKDISKCFTETEVAILEELELKLYEYRLKEGKQPFNCVVVEQDWPMYEQVWKMIEEWTSSSDGRAGD